MPLENESKRIYLNLEKGLFSQRISDTQTQTNNKLSRVHLVNVVLQKVRKDKNDNNSPVIGEILQLHFIDATEYYVVKTWVNSSYAKAFFCMMENLDLVHEMTIITRENWYENKDYGNILINQLGQPVKWVYTNANPGEMPLLQDELIQDNNAPGGTRIVKSNKLQVEFFKEKLINYLLPKLKMKLNPYPNHPIFEGIVGNKEIAGNYFPDKGNYRTPAPVGEAERNFNANDITEAIDDLPF